MNTQNTSTIHYYNTCDSLAAWQLAKQMTLFLEEFFTDSRQLILLCIGTDRVTGDSLGPLVGHHLKKRRLKNVEIYGTLKEPVHALNLKETVSHIKTVSPDIPILAIDASLGCKEHLGFVTIQKGAINPGAGVHKSLDAVGDLSITGIVNLSGSFEQMILQTTRLSTVVTMAECIATAIFLAWTQHLKQYTPIYNTIKIPSASAYGDALASQYPNNNG